MAQAYADVGSAAARGITAGTRLGLAVRGQRQSENRDEFERLQQELENKRLEKSERNKQNEQALAFHAKLGNFEGVATAARAMDTDNGTNLAERLTPENMKEFSKRMLEIDKAEPHMQERLIRETMGAYPVISQLRGPERMGVGLTRAGREAAVGAGPEAMGERQFLETGKAPAVAKAPAPAPTKEIYDPKTKATRVKQWNPATSRYDIDIGEKTPAKVTADRRKAIEAKYRVTGQLKHMRNLYTILKKNNAIIDADKDIIDNLAAWARSSAGGQMLARRMGTKMQSVRNQISATRPLMINNIRQAAEMGAKGMDSERELAFYLQAATNPSLDVQSNFAAINVLDYAYGQASITGEPLAPATADELKAMFINSGGDPEKASELFDETLVTEVSGLTKAPMGAPVGAPASGRTPEEEAEFLELEKEFGGL